MLDLFTYKAKVLKVVDGDTIVVEIDLGFKVKREETLRFARVDTAEIHGVKKLSEEYAAGMLSTEFVLRWFENHNWECVIKTDKDKTGKYGRYIAEIYSPDQTESLQDLLIQEGFDKNSK